MSPILMAEQPGPDTDLKSYSCLTCRQRKVKCDRHNPCFNCVKAGRRCSFISPVRGKRKRTKAPKEGLHAKLRRYEELLKSYGAKIEPSEYGGNSDSETVSQPDMDMTEDADPRSKTGLGSFALEGMKPRLVDKEGSSRYFDRYACCYFRPQIESSLTSSSSLWSNLGGEVSLSFYLSLLTRSFLITNSFLVRKKRALLSLQMSRTFTSLTSLLVLLSNMVLRQTLTPKLKTSQVSTLPTISC